MLRSNTSSFLRSVNWSVGEVVFEPFHVNIIIRLLTQNAFAQLPMWSFRNMQKSSMGEKHERKNRKIIYTGAIFWNHGRKHHFPRVEFSCHTNEKESSLHSEKLMKERPETNSLETLASLAARSTQIRLRYLFKNSYKFQHTSIWQILISRGDGSYCFF